MVNLNADALELTLGLRLMKKVKVFAYLRCSHRLQRDDGFSLDTQRALISDYVAKMGLEVNEIVWIEDAEFCAFFNFPCSNFKGTVVKGFGYAEIKVYSQPS